MKKRTVTLLLAAVLLGTANAQNNESLYFPYTEHPGYLIAFSYRPAANEQIIAVLDSMGLAIEKKFAYCTWKGDLPDTNTFIIRKKNNKPFKAYKCKELEFLRKRMAYLGAIGPLITLKDANELKDINGHNAYGMENQLQIVSIAGATEEKVKALAAKYGLELLEGMQNSLEGRKVWTLEAPADTGNGIARIAEKLSKEKLVFSVQVMINALVCPG